MKVLLYTIGFYEWLNLAYLELDLCQKNGNHYSLFHSLFSNLDKTD